MKIKNINSFDKNRISYNVKRKSTKTFLVFLHGAGGNLHVWNKKRQILHKKNISTCAIDLRGHGASERPQKESSYDLSNFAKDIKCVLEHEKITKFILVGHCFGGMVAIQFAKLYPEIAQSYILIDTTHTAPPILQTIFKLPKRFISIVNRRLEKVSVDANYNGSTNYNKFIGTGDFNPFRILQDIRNTTLKSWIFIYNNIAEFDGRSTLKSIKKPVLIISGGNDRIFSTKVAKQIHDYTKNSKYAEVPNANHVLVINNVKEIAQIISDYVVENKLIC